jgi:hypothetical protein
MSPLKQTDLVGGSAKLYGSGKTRMINIPGVTTEETNYSGGGTFKNKEEKDWYDAEIKKRVDSGMSQEEASQDYRNTYKIGEKKSTTVTTPGTTKEIKTPGWEGTLMEETRGTVMQPWEIRQQSRADKKIARDQFRSNIKAGMSREEAKAARNKFLQQQANARAAQQAFSAESGQLAGGTFRTGQRAMLQGQLSKSEQREMLAAQNETEQARRERVTVADTGLANSTPDASRLMRGTNPLEEKQPGIAKSRGYKMGGYGSKNKK